MTNILTNKRLGSGDGDAEEFSFQFGFNSNPSEDKKISIKETSMSTAGVRANSIGRQNAKARLASLKQTYNSSKLEDLFPVRDSQNFN